MGSCSSYDSYWSVSIIETPCFCLVHAYLSLSCWLMNNTVPRFCYWLPFLTPPVFMSKELRILGPCIKCHYLLMPLYLLILLYPWTLHILSNCVLKAQWNFKPSHETHKLVSVLAEWQKWRNLHQAFSHCFLLIFERSWVFKTFFLPEDSETSSWSFL